jgi:glycosyltransferase involved in cell wall biosynthesis
MTIKVLAIGDLANNVTTMKEFLKSEIHLINFPWETMSKIMDEKKDVEFFESIDVLKNLKKINQIKNDYDICLVLSSAGARIAYLADLNYILFVVGNDIRTPLFIKNVKDPYASNEPIFKLNFFERKFYRDVYMNAITCVAGYSENFKFLKKFRKDARRIDRTLVNTNILKKNIDDENLKFEKFTFFSPQRIALQKGYDIILESLPMCQTKFEIIQVKWFETRNEKEIKFMNKILKEKPNQIKFVEPMPRDKLAKYYSDSDAILGQMRAGHVGGVERESALFKKATIAYNDLSTNYIIDGKEIKSPFLPTDTTPNSLALLIDKIVSSKKFKEELAREEFEFIKQLTDPVKTAKEWDDLFEEFTVKCNSINRNSSKIRLKFRLFFFLVVNRLYWYKMKKIFKKKN